MFRKFVSLILVSAVLTVVPALAQRRAAGGDTEFAQLFKNRTSVDQLIFTEADGKKFQKESLNRQAKKSGFSNTAKVGIGVGIAAGLIIAIVLATSGNDESARNIQCVQAPCP